MIFASFRAVLFPCHSPGASVSKTFKYRAFLSYGRAEAYVARRVCGRLERFRIDREFVGRITRYGPVPETLGPIFRNRHDFLTRPTVVPETAAALADSAAFIILASPHSAQSKYVNKQVRLFKSRYPERPVIVLIVDRRPDDTYGLAPTVRFAVAPEWAENPAEVLPPDLEHKADGFELAIAKIVGRLIGIAADDVFRRAQIEQRRRMRIRMAAAAATLILTLGATTGLWKVHQYRAMRTEIATLVDKYIPLAPSQAAVPGARESLTQAITAIGEGAAAEPRYAKALELLKASMAAEAAAPLKAVAQDKPKRGAKTPKEAAAAYRTLGAIAAISDSGAARDYYEQAVRLDPSDFESWFHGGWLQQQAGHLDAAEASYLQVIKTAKVYISAWVLWAHLGRGDIARERGRLDDALIAYREAEDVARILAHADPDNAASHYDVGISNERVGDALMAQGYSLEAMKSYHARREIMGQVAKIGLGKTLGRTEAPREADSSSRKAGDVVPASVGADPLAEVLASHQATLAIMARLARADFHNSGWQRDLASSYDRVGNLLVWQDNLPEALKSYQAALGILDRLARVDPGNVGWQRDLALAYIRTGDVLAQQHNLFEAMKSYQAALAIEDRLAKADPADTRWLGVQAATNNKVGDVLAEQDNLADAVRSYRVGLAIAEGLARGEPDNARLQRDVWATHSKIGNVLAEEGNAPEALKSFQAGLAIAERLAKAQPANAVRQSELSEMYDTVADVLKSQGDLVEAVKFYQAGLAIAEKLADPANASRQRDISVGYSAIGDMLKLTGNLPDALKSYSAGLAIAERLAGKDPANATRWRDLAVAHSEVGDVLRARGDLPEALKSFNASLFIMGRVARGEPGNAGWQRDLAATHSGLADVLKAQGKWREAQKSYLDGLAIAERLVKTNPGNAAWQRDLSMTYVRLADFYRKSGKDKLARQTLAEARGIMARLVAQFPNQPRFKHDFAWFDPQTASLKK
jgi:tetratricopeptide (TPR) repeat protein